MDRLTRLLSEQQKRVITITGPVSSGKTYMIEKCLETTPHETLSAADTHNMSKKLLHINHRHSKTYLTGLLPNKGNQLHIVIVEDAECAPRDALLRLYENIRIICVSNYPQRLDRSLLLNHIRTQKPRIDDIAKWLIQFHSADSLIASRIAASCNRDYRQAVFMFSTGSSDKADESSLSEVDNIVAAFAGTNKLIPDISISNVFENYNKCDCLSIKDVCRITDDISTSDRYTTGIDDIFSNTFIMAAIAPLRGKRLVSRPTTTTTGTLSCSKLPFGINLENIRNVRLRIVESLKWAPVNVVINEMLSIGITSITQWDIIAASYIPQRIFSFNVKRAELKALLEKICPPI